MICLVLTGNKLEDSRRIIRDCRPLIGIGELRIDYLERSEYSQIADFARKTDLPLILTCRREKDGGRFIGSEGEREALLSAILSGTATGTSRTFGKGSTSGKKADFPGGIRYVDLEEDAGFTGVEESARKQGIAVIRSYHSFKPFSKDDENRIASIPYRFPDALPKAAVTVNGTAELLSLLKFSRTVQPPAGKKIILAMGEYGIPSRLLYKEFGSFLTFCSPGGVAAPGQLGPLELAELYRCDTITPATRLFGILGDPILHSRSPAIHNPAFLHQGIDARYLLFPADDLESFIALAGEIGVQGFSVTSPFKEKIIPFLAGMDRAVEKIESCNTVVRKGEGWYGLNTDYSGFLLPLKRFWKQTEQADFPLRAGGKPGKAAIIGAGGAARTVVQALKDEGIETTVLNRSPERARLLADRYRCGWGGLEDHEVLSASSLVVQTTTAGMTPDENTDPIPGYRFRPGQILYDLIYSPEKTRLMRRAEEAGCFVLGGKEMLREQGCLQFEAFTGIPYPRSLFGV